MNKRIYYHDTDCGGVVYYSNYLKYMEEARTEFFENSGILIQELANAGILFVVVRQEVDYESPAFYADCLQVEAKITDMSRVKIVFEQTVKNQNGKIVCRGKTFMVCVDKSIRPQGIPEELKKKLNSAC